MHSVTGAAIIRVAPTLYATRQPVHKYGMVGARREIFAGVRADGVFCIKPIRVKGPDVSGRFITYMPNNAAAEKRMRQEQKRRLHNRSIKSLVRTQVTKARTAIATGENSEEAVRNAVSELDRAAKKGVIHRNNAARRKSRLMKQLNATK